MLLELLSQEIIKAINYIIDLETLAETLFFCIVVNDMRVCAIAQQTKKFYEVVNKAKEFKKHWFRLQV